MSSIRTDSEYDSATDLESTYFVETDLSDFTESHFSDESTESWSYLKVFLLAFTGLIIGTSLIFGVFNLEHDINKHQQTTANNNNKQQQTSSKTNSSRIAIIHSFYWVNFPHTDEYVTRGGPFDSRDISESYDWLRWIVDNYNDLPDYSVFLHGHKSSWHTPPDFVQQVNEAKPDRVQMLGKKIWSKNEYYNENELKGLNQLHQMLYSRDFKQVAEETCLWTRRCCAEMVVSRKAIQQHPPSTYRKMIDLIKADPEQPWGWIFERSWENMFNYQKRECLHADSSCIYILACYKVTVSLLSLFYLYVP